MSLDTFERSVMQELVNWAAAAYPGLVVVAENAPNLDELQVQEFLDVEFRYYAASDATVGVRPIVRDSGAVSIRHYARQQTGSGRTRQVLESLREEFRARRLGGGVLSAPQLTVPTSPKGWYSRGVLIPFTVDTQ